MKISMDILSRVFSNGLNLIEEEQVGVSEHHSLRIAALCSAMGKKLGYDNDTLAALAYSALFHENALTEYHLSEKEIKNNGPNMILHCQKGQSNVSWLPFKTDIDGIILYHHEKGNGQGPFQKRDGEYPFAAALLAAADAVDFHHPFHQIKAEELISVRDKIAANADAYSTRFAISVLLETLDNEMLESLCTENISQTLDNTMPRWEVDVCEESIFGIACFLAHVIDNKSKFTQKHTRQITGRSWLMAKHYGYGQDERSALFLAASLHDIGKLATPTEVLEKPGKLTTDEFDLIKKHVWYTNEWLKDIPNFDQIRNWAADHHEKLDGSGYPFGKNAEQLDFNSRLIACLDVYQAVSEPRPYHGARTHESTMQIMNGMADRGLIDSAIVKDIDMVMEVYSMRNVPVPSCDDL